MILADTSIWIDHLHHANLDLLQHLERGRIVMHPFIVAEVALGSLHNRRKTLALMEELGRVEVVHLDEVRSMIEVHSLYSHGIGLTDAHLLASCLITPGTQLWTRDSRLRRVAQALGVHAELPPFTAN